MTEQEIDTFCKSELVAKNPWKFTPKQCLALHLVCLFGTLKAASEVTGIQETTLKWNLKQARHRRKMGGNDVRIYLLWNSYARSFA